MAKANEEQLATIVQWHGERQATLTDDQRASNKEMFKALMADPEKMAAMKAEGDATFAAADTNSNGVLTLAEYRDFAEKSTANAKAKGWAVPDSTDADTEKWWNMMCTIAGTPDGISKADHDSISGQMMQVYASKMQE